MLHNPVRWVDVLLRRPPRPDDERERKGKEIADLEVEYDLTYRRIRRLIENWRRRA